MNFTGIFEYHYARVFTVPYNVRNEATVRYDHFLCICYEVIVLLLNVKCDAAVGIMVLVRGTQEKVGGRG